jgi:hypothetical protein
LSKNHTRFQPHCNIFNRVVKQNVFERGGQGWEGGFGKEGSIPPISPISTYFPIPPFNVQAIDASKEMEAKKDAGSDTARNVSNGGNKWGCKGTDDVIWMEV